MPQILLQLSKNYQWGDGGADKNLNLHRPETAVAIEKY